MVPHLNAVLIAPIAKNNLSILKRQLQQHSSEITILGLANSIEKGRKLIDIHQPNIVFIDVCKPFCEGFEMLKLLNPINYEIIFINSCPECPFHNTTYVKGSYLKSPVNAAELKASIAVSQTNILHTLQQQQHNKTEPAKQKHIETSLRVKTKNGHERIDFNKITYLSAHGNYTHIHLLNGTVMVECKILKLVEELLTEHIFCRIDRSFIANKKYIKQFDNMSNKVTMTDDKILPVSKRKKASFILFYEG